MVCGLAANKFVLQLWARAIKIEIIMLLLTQTMAQKLRIKY